MCVRERGRRGLIYHLVQRTKQLDLTLARANMAECHSLQIAFFFLSFFFFFFPSCSIITSLVSGVYIYIYIYLHESTGALL